MDSTVFQPVEPSDTLADSSPGRPVRPVTVLLLLAIVVLGSALIVQQRREARLREALAAYKGRSQGQIVRTLGTGWLQFDWPEGTTLEDAIELIKARSAMSLSFPKGVPILVDPDALRRAGKSLKSPLAELPPNPDPKITFRKRLRAVLEPMGLAYEVKDGAIMITTPDAIEHPDVDPPEDDGGIAP